MPIQNQTATSPSTNALSHRAEPRHAPDGLRPRVILTVRPLPREIYDDLPGEAETATYYAVFLRPGSLWDPDRSAREQTFWDEHARHMDALFDTGAVVLGGPFADRTGSMVVVRAQDATQAREMFRNDPWTMRDVLVTAEVKEWIIFLDGRNRH